MTPEQMLKAIAPHKTCEPCEEQKTAPPRVNIEALIGGMQMDFARAQGLDEYACLKKGFCPICGRRVTTEIDYASNHRIASAWCANREHIFEIDHETSSVDRIEGSA